MKILSSWLREYLPALDVSARQLADDLTLRGIAVEGFFPFDNGALFEMDITTNRVDAMNHYGIAREAAAIYNVALQPLDVSLPQAKPAAKPFAVKIEATDLCGRFTARVVRGIKVGVSSGKLAEYFTALGQKQISNAVDITNFVWMAMGQPTHAFDLDKLEGGIIVRYARKGEKLKLLDGTDRTLEADDLVVADEKKAIALAGVMGGWDTMITLETKNILVEAAWFSPASVRRSSRRHGLHTDASHRFERGADFNAAPVANALVTKLILEACGGSIEGDLIDVVVSEAAAKTANRPAITLSVAEVGRHLGETLDGKGISAEIIEQYLSALGCKLLPAAAGSYSVTLPSWRLDLEREIDLIEEVARVYGYNKFANTLPSFSGEVVELPYAHKESTLRTVLLTLGYSEAISSTFCAEADAELFAAAPNSAVPMGNPLSEQAGMLRPSLVPGMLGMLAHNLNRDVADLRFFEMGTIFTGSTDSVHEQPSLVIGATGGALATNLYSKDEALFFEIKGAIETLLAKFAHTSLTFDTAILPPWLHPGRAARAVLDGVTTAVFGQLDSIEESRRKLKQPVFIAEINLAHLYTLALRQPIAHELSRFPAVERDFSLVFADAVRWQQISDAVNTLQIATLLSTTPIEIFRDSKGKNVPAGHYSLLLRVVFQSPERTLREEELTVWSQSIVEALTRLGGKLRA